MSNFSTGEDGSIAYTEPRDAEIYRSEAVLSSEFEEEGKVGLCLTVYGGGNNVCVGIGDEADVQEFLYSSAVKAKLIKDGEPLILMRKVTADAEDLA